MSSSASAVLVAVVCPTLGAILSNAMALSPLSLVLKARRNRHLGKVNPIPFAIMFVANVGYIVYGALLANYYIFFSSIFSMMIALFYCVTCLTIMAKEAKEDEFSEQYVLLEALVIGGVGFWALMAMIETTIFSQFLNPRDQASTMTGTLCAFLSICYYGAPLSTMAEVMHTRDASSLYLPMILMNMCNATLWMLYGAFGVKTVVIWLPPALGLVLSCVQIGLVLVYHRGHWLEAVTGWITHRTIHRKTRVGEVEAAMSDSARELLSSPEARRMSFVVAPTHSSHTFDMKPYTFV
jgi:solute carrier family 50 (sugar transporter)